MKDKINKLKIIISLCYCNGFNFDFNPHSDVISVYHMDDEYRHLFYLTSYIDGPLFDYTDEINNVYPIDEMIIKLKKYIKTLK